VGVGHGGYLARENYWVSTSWHIDFSNAL